MTSSGHVTSSVTSPFDSAWPLSLRRRRCVLGITPHFRAYLCVSCFCIERNSRRDRDLCEIHSISQAFDMLSNVYSLSGYLLFINLHLICIFRSSIFSVPDLTGTGKRGVVIEDGRASVLSFDHPHVHL